MLCLSRRMRGAGQSGVGIARYWDRGGRDTALGGLLQVLLTSGRHEEHLEEHHEEQHPSHSLGHCSATPWGQEPGAEVTSLPRPRRRGLPRRSVTCPRHVGKGRKLNTGGNQTK